MKRIIITALLATLSMAGVQSVNCETKKVILCPENIQKTTPETGFKNDYTGPQANQEVIKFLKKVANTKYPKKRKVKGVGTQSAEKNGLTYTYDSAGEVIRVANTIYTLHVGQLERAGKDIATNKENAESNETQTTQHQIRCEGPNPQKIFSIKTEMFCELQTIGINENNPVWVVTAKNGENEGENEKELQLAFAQPATIRTESVLDKFEGGCVLGTLLYGTIRAMDLVLRWNPPQFRPEVEEILTKDDKSSPFRAIVQSKWCYVLNAAALGWSFWKLSDVLSHTSYEIEECVSADKLTSFRCA